MREGGLFDRFPLQLVATARANARILVVDDPDLGFLQLSPWCSDSARCVAVSSDRECLEKTSAKLGRHVQCVRVDPRSLPFPDTFFEGAIRVENGESSIEGKDASAGGGELDEISRVLQSSGWLAVIEKGRRRETRAVANTWTRIRQYSVRPLCGSEYFVSVGSDPAEWLIKDLHVGRRKSVVMGIEILLRRFGFDLPGSRGRLTIYFKGDGKSIVDRSLEGLSADGREERDPSASFGLFVKTDWNAIVLDRGQGQVVVKYPLCSFVSSGLKRHSRNLNALESECSLGPEPVIPDVLKSGVVDAQEFFIETRCAGAVATKYWWRPRLKRKVVRAGCRFLVKLHGVSRRDVTISHEDILGLLEPPLTGVESAVSALGGRSSLEQLTERLGELFGNRRIPLVRSHGDFWQGNLLVSREGDLTGVLDWDMSEKDDLPVVDLVHLIAFQRKWLAIWHLGWLVKKKLMPMNLASWERRLIERYLEDLSIEASLWTGFVAIYWLRRIAQLLAQKQRVCDERWLEKNCIQALPGILDLLR